jgi:hypothetical protein
MITEEMADYWDRMKREQITLAPPPMPWLMPVESITAEEFESRWPGRAQAEVRYVPSIVPVSKTSS